jgi:hypothetical protein
MSEKQISDETFSKQKAHWQIFVSEKDSDFHSHFCGWDPANWNLIKQQRWIRAYRRITDEAGRPFIRHINSYFDVNSNCTSIKSWDITEELSSPRGIIHPATLSRGPLGPVFLMLPAPRAFAWSGLAGVELMATDDSGKLRVSAIFNFDSATGALSAVSAFREDARGWAGPHWHINDTAVKPTTDPADILRHLRIADASALVGEGHCRSSGLELARLAGVAWAGHSAALACGGSITLLLPDGIAMIGPPVIPAGRTPYSLALLWATAAGREGTDAETGGLISPELRYGAGGEFECVRGLVFRAGQ